MLVERWTLGSKPEGDLHGRRAADCLLTAPETAMLWWGCDRGRALKKKHCHSECNEESSFINKANLFELDPSLRSG